MYLPNRHWLLVGLLLAPTLWAEPQAPATTSLDAATRASIAAKLPPAKPEDVFLAADGALYEVRVGSRSLYVTRDGKYLVAGDLYDMVNKKNMSDEGRRSVRIHELAQVKDADAVIFAPDGPVRHTITVFTDMDCTYCRKFHSEIAEINKMGIRVRYVAFPRSGPNTDSWYKAEAVWCSKDRKQALTRSKLGEAVTAPKCDSPVADQFHMGERIGARGTPLILTDSADLISGYQPPDKLLFTLDEFKREAIASKK